MSIKLDPKIIAAIKDDLRGVADKWIERYDIQPHIAVATAAEALSMELRQEAREAVGQVCDSTPYREIADGA